MNERACRAGMPVQVTAAVGQPADFVAIRAGRVVAMRFVVPHGNHRGLQARVVLASHHACSQIPMEAKRQKKHWIYLPGTRGDRLTSERVQDFQIAY